MSSKYHRRSVLAGAVVFSVLVSACGTDDEVGGAAATVEESAPQESADASEESASHESDQSTDESEPAAEESSSSSDSTEASDADPVKVMVMGSFVGPFDTSFALDTAMAAARAENAEGVGASTIEVLTCDDQFDPNKTLECVRTAVDEGVVALVVALVLNGDYVALAEQARIPVIPVVGFQAAEFQSELAFPIGTGAAGYGAAAIAELLHAGVTNLSLVYDETNGLAKPAAESAAAGLEASGITVSNIVPMPIDIADASAILAAAESNDAEGVGLLVQGSQAAQLLQAREQAGSDLLFGSYDLSLEPATIEALGSAAEGVLMASPFKQLTSVDDPAVARFHDELAAYDASISTDDWSIPGVGIGTWVGVHLVAEAVRAADSPDAEGVLAALPTLTNFDSGMAAPIDFSAPKDVIPGFSRVFNTSFLFNEIQDGVVVPVSDGYVDVFAQG